MPAPLQPRWFGLLVLLPGLLGCASGGALSHRTSRTIDELFADYAGANVPGASVLVIHDGRVAFNRAYGMADLEHRVPATPGTDYRLASLTKQFTAMAIMLLAGDGKLRDDEPVRDLLRELGDSRTGTSRSWC